MRGVPRSVRRVTVSEPSPQTDRFAAVAHIVSAGRRFGRIERRTSHTARGPGRGNRLRATRTLRQSCASVHETVKRRNQPGQWSARSTIDRTSPIPIAAATLVHSDRCASEFGFRTRTQLRASMQHRLEKDVTARDFRSQFRSRYTGSRTDDANRRHVRPVPRRLPRARDVAPWRRSQNVVERGRLVTTRRQRRAAVLTSPLAGQSVNGDRGLPSHCIFFSGVERVIK